MTDDELLAKVKAINAYGENEFSDLQLSLMIDEAKDYLKNAGVSETVIGSNASVGVIAYMVADLKDKVGLSEFVQNKIVQLRCIPDVQAD